ncbi:hypothetical protein ILYODFUR_021440 [Ilyodon furcidens]|uniref:Secreted protein n=1 Tax=Ilyodon furcidens TaxID=33524 RepID=A0ABV0UV22_9TELE
MTVCAFFCQIGSWTLPPSRMHACWASAGEGCALGSWVSESMAGSALWLLACSPGALLCCSLGGSPDGSPPGGPLDVYGYDLLHVRLGSLGECLWLLPSAIEYS